MAVTRMFPGFSHFNFGAILARFERAEPVPDAHANDFARREMLNEMLSRDCTICSSEYGM